MSRPRSRSPNFRKHPGEKPGFGPPNNFLELDRNHQDRRRHFRDGPRKHGNGFGDSYQEGPRRPPFPDGHQYRHTPQDHIDFQARRPSHRRPSPHHDGKLYEDKSFRKNFQEFDPREPVREKEFPHSDHQQRDAAPNWRREGHGRDHARFTDSCEFRLDSRERGRKSPPVSERGRVRDHPQHEREPQPKRRNMESADRLGYKNEENFGGKGFSLDAPRGGFRGGGQGRPDTLVFDHNHGTSGTWKPPQLLEDRRRHDPGFDRLRSPRSGGSQERFRFNRRPDDLKDARDYRFRDDAGEPGHHGGKGSPRPQERHRDNREDFTHQGGIRNSPGGRLESTRNQKSFHGYQDVPGYRAFRDNFSKSFEEEPNWEGRAQPGSLERRSQKDNTSPGRSSQWEPEWPEQKVNNQTVVTEESLTIKVDMSQPADLIRPPCNSTERQLSFDLVNVGRKRLDFLPMLEHSGTYQEGAVHTGTFAQEIITLVHFVKDEYFRGNGITLNERFSAPQDGGYKDDAPEEMTLSQRFGSHRGFGLNTEDDDEFLLSRLANLQGLRKQPLRGPGDLRHDLERRRQEKLEGVSITIQGKGIQHFFPETSENIQQFPRNQDGFSSDWQRSPNRREVNHGPRDLQHTNKNFDHHHDMQGGSTDPTW